MHWGRLLCVCMLFQGFNNIKAQQSFGLYHASSIPQRNMLNPAFLIPAQAVVGLPGLSGTTLQFYNSSFTLSQLAGSIEQQNDSSTLNLNRLLNLFNNQNRICLKAGQQWLFASKRSGKNQFTIQAGEQAAFQFNYPKDLFQLLIDGNGGSNLGRTFNLRFSLNAIHYRELGFSFAREIHEQLRVGAGIKFLKGYSIIDASRLSVNLNTGEDQFDWTATSDINIRCASTGFSTLEKLHSVRPIDFFRRSKNPGMALDLGIQWQESPRLVFSASLLNFGFINWKNNAATFKTVNRESSFRFEGINYNFSDNSDAGTYLKRIRDSINKSVGIDTLRGSFSSRLSTELFCGMQYFFNAKTSFQALVYTDFFMGSFHPALHTGLQWQPNHWLQIMIHNTTFNNIGFNPGLGISLHAGKAHIYASTEQVYAFKAIDQTRSFSFKFGVNVLLNKDNKNIRNISDPERPLLEQQIRELNQWGR